MKIQLERRLPTCPPQLKCVACAQTFPVEKIRSLLCDRAGLIQGDLCPGCRRAPDLQAKLHVTEPIHRPQFYTWWWKRWAILAEASQEIEGARFAAARCGRRGCSTPKSLRIRFQMGDR